MVHDAAETRRQFKNANDRRWRASTLGRLTNQISSTRYRLRESGSPALAAHLAALEAERDRIRATGHGKSRPVEDWRRDLKTAILDLIAAHRRPTLSVLMIELGWPRSTLATRMRVLGREWSPGDEARPSGRPDSNAPTPEQIRERVAEIRREKGLPEVAYRI